MNNPRDRSQFKYIALQAFPSNWEFAMEAYEDATSEPHGYLFMDFKQNATYRLQTGIIPGQKRIVYFDD